MKWFRWRLVIFYVFTKPLLSMWMLGVPAPSESSGGGSRPPDLSTLRRTQVSGMLSTRSVITPVPPHLLSTGAGASIPPSSPAYHSLPPPPSLQLGRSPTAGNSGSVPPFSCARSFSFPTPPWRAWSPLGTALFLLSRGGGAYKPFAGQSGCTPALLHYNRC